MFFKEKINLNLKKKLIILRSFLILRFNIDFMRLCIVKFCLKLLFFLLLKLIGKKLKECMNVVKMNIFFL